MDILPEEMIFEILLRLPVQSLLQLRSVSKYLCNTIDSFIFKNSHLLQNTDQDALYLLFTHLPFNSQLSMSKGNDEKSYKLGFFPFEKFDGHDRLAVIGPVNGLICVHNKDSSPLIVVCNPCLGETKILPVSPVAGEIYSIGFGFDYIRKEYKVVKLTFFKEKHAYVEVYSPTANTWRKVDTNVFDDEEYFLPLNICAINNSPYKVSGKWAHWLIEDFINENNVYKILSFDMHNEVFKKSHINIPARTNTLIIGVYAKDDGDSFVTFIHKWPNHEVEIWEGKKGSWSHVVDVDLGWSKETMVWTEALWKREGAVIVEYGRKEGMNLFIYDYSKKEINSLEMPNMYDGTVMLEYKPTLISP